MATFPFLSLPPEIRLEIYRLCLRSESPLNVESFEHCLMLKRPLYKPAAYHDIHFSLSCGDAIFFNENLLHASRQIHEEAVPIFYGHNTFQFQRETYWKALACFDKHLTRLSRRAVRAIHIELPAIHGDPSSLRTTRICRPTFIKSMQISRRIPNLRDLTLIVKEDIMRCDIPLLQQVHAAAGTDPENPHVFVKVLEARKFHSAQKPRAVMISSEALRTMQQEWKWDVQGNWKLISKDDPFHYEKAWRTWLRQERRIESYDGIPDEYYL